MEEAVPTVVAEKPRKKVVIDYAPRKWAQKFHGSFLRWLVLVVHRRAGKTLSVIHHHQRSALDDGWERRRLRSLLPDADDKTINRLVRGADGRGRVYWHVMPTYKQAKLVAWEKVKQAAEPIPGRVFNETELKVKYPNGSSIQLIGADNEDSLRGPALSGVSFDEYSQISNTIFGTVVSKSLADHLGYGIFAGTIQGHDQLYKMFEAVKNDPDWFSIWQNIDESLITESGATITALIRAMEDDRKLVLQGIMSQAEFDQEWYLSPEAAIKGAIFGDQIRAARESGRITNVPYDPILPVDTDWDLGVGDSTSIWFSQSSRSGEVRIIDYEEGYGEGLPYYAKKLQDRGYIYGTHWAPHDIEVQELGTGKTRKETAASLGIKFRTVPRLHGEKGQEVEDGIHAVRMLFPRMWFDQVKCKVGLDELAHYRRQYNTRMQEFTATPVHDFASHCFAGETRIITRHGRCQIQYLPPTGEVLTLCGWKAYRHPRITRRNAPLVEVVFNDGFSVKCTADHLFLTANGWRSAVSLSQGSLIRSSWTPSPPISRGKSINDGPRNGIGQEERSGARRSNVGCIDAYGPWRSVWMCLRDVTSTIVMAIQTTTAYRILNVFQPMSICLTHGMTGMRKDSSRPLVLSRAPARQHGISLRLAVSGTESRRASLNLGRNGSVKSAIASIAISPSSAGRSYGSMGIRKNTAPRRARLSRIVSDVRRVVASAVKKIWDQFGPAGSSAPATATFVTVTSVSVVKETANVWCLEVPDVGHFCLENGAVVHNCADALRGLAVRHRTPVEKKRPESERRYVDQADSGQGWMRLWFLVALIPACLKFVYR